jgi:hypothetical protein
MHRLHNAHEVDNTRALPTKRRISSLQGVETVNGAPIALFPTVLDSYDRARLSTRELTLDETLGVLGDRVTRKLPALRRTPLAVAVPFSGSTKRTRRMRAYRFKALSLEQLLAQQETAHVEVKAEAHIEEERYMRPPDVQTIKIDRVAVRRIAWKRAVVATLTIALMIVVGATLL